MKKILFILFAIIYTNIASAQTQVVKDLALLKSELDTIVKNGLPINAVTLSPDGNWTVIYGDMGYAFVKAPSATAKK